MKRSVTTDTEEIKEIMEKVGEEDQRVMRGFLFGGKAVLVSGEATGKHSVYGAAVEVVVDKEFSDYLPHARSIIMWIGANNAALSDVNGFLPRSSERRGNIAKAPLCLRAIRRTGTG